RNPENQFIHYSFSSTGEQKSEDHPDKGVTEYRYDRFGQLRFSMDANDRAYTSFPDPNVSCAAGNCRKFKYVKYDELGREIEQGEVYKGGFLFDNAQHANDPTFPHVIIPHKARIINQYGTGAFENRGKLTMQSVQYSFIWNQGLNQFQAGAPDTYTFQYGKHGRLKERFWILDGLPGTHRKEYAYNQTGLLISDAYDHPASNFRYVRSFAHDEFARPIGSYSATYDLATQSLVQQQQIASYHYDAVGRLFRQQIGATNPGQWLEEIDDFHDIRGRQTRRESRHFRYELSCDQRGNILINRWQNDHFDTDKTRWNQYKYQYDYFNRLLAADFSTVKYAGIGDPPQRWASNPGETPYEDGAMRYADAKDILDPFPLPDPNGITRNPQRFTCDYDQHPTSKTDLIAKVPEAALDGFIPSYHLGGIDFLECQIHPDRSFKTFDELDLTSANFPPQPGDKTYSVYGATEEEARIEAVNYPGMLRSIQRVTGSNQWIIEKTDIGPGNFAVIEPKERYDTWYTLDRVGNFSKFRRKTWNGQHVREQHMDHYYDPGKPNNRLNAINTPIGVPSVELFDANYSYDAVGNVLTDTETGITATEYDWRNLPTRVVRGLNSVNYRYDAGGLRVARDIQFLGVPNFREYYIDGIILDENGAIKRFPTAHGYATVNMQTGKLEHHYAVKDWLGTNRVVLDEQGITEYAADFYPYGKPLGQREFISDPESNRMQFTGHERDKELPGIDYHGARYFNGEIGRYLSVDPLQADFVGWSAYNYVLCNPIMFIDPDGMGPIIPLTNSRFIRLMAEKGIIGHGIVFNRQKGYALEQAFFGFRTDLEHNTSEHFATQFPNYRVRPDAVSNSREWMLDFPIVYWGTFQSDLYEVKASKYRIGASRQIKGEIHAAANARSSGITYNLLEGQKRAADRGLAVLNIVTLAPSGIEGLLDGEKEDISAAKLLGVKRSVLREAQRNNVQLNWSFAMIDSETQEIYFTPFITLNSSSYPGGSVRIHRKQIINVLQEARTR
ncbi:MAG: RHS repeat-associated core domain-containing protein, partial [Bacteroidota bacterium]